MEQRQSGQEEDRTYRMRFERVREESKHRTQIWIKKKKKKEKVCCVSMKLTYFGVITLVNTTLLQKTISKEEEDAQTTFSSIMFLLIKY